MTLRVLNDLHLGAIRTAGTTPETRVLLRKRLQEQFKALLPERQDLMILGDLFDTGDVPLDDLLAAHETLSHWLQTSGRDLYLVAGNHDNNKTSNVMSSFDALASLLRAYPNVVVIKDRPMMTAYGYVIPHLPNQDLFDLELSRMPPCEVLYLHCNVSNSFAKESDHSLNISLEQIAAAPAKRIVVAHEHHARTLGKVTIPGNQLGSSVADWLSPGDKQFAKVYAGMVELQTCTQRSDEFIELDWRNLRPATQPFIRIGGSATAQEAAAALAAVAAYRRSSPALVVTNAVKVETVEGDDYEVAVEAMAGFDVMSMLKDVLEPSEMKILENLK